MVGEEWEKIVRVNFVFERKGTAVHGIKVVNPDGPIVEHPELTNTEYYNQTGIKRKSGGLDSAEINALREFFKTI